MTLHVHVLYYRNFRREIMFSLVLFHKPMLHPPNTCKPQQCGCMPIAKVYIVECGGHYVSKCLGTDSWWVSCKHTSVNIPVAT